MHTIYIIEKGVHTRTAMTFTLIKQKYTSVGLKLWSNMSPTENWLPPASIKANQTFHIGIHLHFKQESQ